MSSERGKFVPSQTDDYNQESYYIFNREEADRLITEALDTSLDEPEPFVRLLLILHDHAHEPRLKDSIYLLMQMAYDGSLIHSIDFEEYLKAIRQGLNSVEKAQGRESGTHDSE
jgi:hypothetical protein